MMVLVIGSVFLFRYHCRFDALRVSQKYMSILPKRLLQYRPMNMRWSTLQRVDRSPRWVRSCSFTSRGVLRSFRLPVRRAGLCHRWISMKQTKEVSEDSRQASVLDGSDAQSWREVLLVVKKRMESGTKDLKLLLLSADERLRELARSDQSPSSGGELCSLLMFWESSLLQPSLWRLRYHPESLNMLHTTSTCAMDLLGRQKFLVDDVAEFLDVFGKLVVRYRIGNHLEDHSQLVPQKWDAMQPFVDKLAESHRNISRRSLLRGLVGSTRLLGLSVPSLMAVVIEKCGYEDVHSMTDEELANLAEALRKLNANGLLLNEALRVFVSRSSEFDPILSARMLRSFPPPVNKDTKTSTHRAFEIVEHQLAAHAIHAPLSVDLVCHLAVSFSLQKYQAKVLDFREFSMKHFHDLSPDNVARLLFYIIGSDRVDNSFLEQFRAYLETVILFLKPRDIAAFLSALEQSSSRRLPATTDCVSLLQRRLTEGSKVLYACRAPIVCSIFGSLVLLKQCLQPLQGLLVDAVFARLSELSPEKLIRFVSAVSKVESSRKYIVLVHKSLCNLIRKNASLTLASASSLAKALGRLCLVDEDVLQRVADVATDAVQKNILYTLDNATFNEIVLIAHCFSDLHFSCPEFFASLYSWLENGHNVLHVYSGSVECKGLVLLIWSMLMQGFYPVGTISVLADWKPEVVNTFPIHVIGKLNIIVMVMADYCQLSVLTKDSLDAVCTGLKNYHESAADGKKKLEIMAFTKDMVRVLPLVDLRRNVLTMEMLGIDFAFLRTTDGNVVRWPANFPQQPSKADVEELRMYGCIPVAIKLFNVHHYLWQSRLLLGHHAMLCRHLEACGWQVMVINTTICYSKSRSAALKYLQQQLNQIGVQAKLILT